MSLQKVSGGVGGHGGTVEWSTVHPDTWARRLELPTWAVIVAIYVGWGLVTWYHASLPGWVLFALGAWITCWHGSLQHETIHGHPTRSATLNMAVAWLPVGLWLPYQLYRDSHTRHHQFEELTCPYHDPESFYIAAEDWAAMGSVRRAFWTAYNTLAGRLLLGPAVAEIKLLKAEIARVRRGDYRYIGAWLAHAVGVTVVLYWVVAVCGMNALVYMLCFAYPGMSLTMLRSFAEHQPDEDAGGRTVVVDASPLMGLLFLNNNLHVLHHDRPGTPWYDLPDAFRASRARLQADGAVWIYRGYAEQFRRFLLTPKDSPVHPLASPCAVAARSADGAPA